MTSDNEATGQSSAEPVSAIKRELDSANVRYENVFARREEIVVVLPGRGTERAAATQAAAKVELHGRHYVSIMAQDGAPPAARLVLAIVIVVVGVFGAVLMLWGYIGAATAGLSKGDSNSPASNEDSDR
jgi:hypothetical protein